MKKYCIISGFIGALILIAIMVAILAWCKPFDYQAVYVVNSDITKIDSLTCTHISALQDLENKGLLLSPQEYTSHISSYYSTLVAFLIGLFILFSFLSFWSIKSTAQKDIEETKNKIQEDIEETKEKIKKDVVATITDSKKFYEGIVDDILGRIHDDVLTKASKEQIDRDMDEIIHNQSKMEEDISLLFDEIDSKSEIKLK